ncbi:hypothetical protein [Microbacterium candidum]|uniref:hypothetical protein n=1 Tax=Microbacterium candidum TaxID=3041922 RepID=UPI0025745C52|nr:hypothetical protein [Microbacterium sp. ASV49]
MTTTGNSALLLTVASLGITVGTLIFLNRAAVGRWNVQILEMGKSFNGERLTRNAQKNSTPKMVGFLGIGFAGIGGVLLVACTLRLGEALPLVALIPPFIVGLAELSLGIYAAVRSAHQKSRDDKRRAYTSAGLPLILCGIFTLAFVAMIAVHAY